MMIVNGFKCFNERWYMNEIQKISKKTEHRNYFWQG